jgi:glutaredoxin 3
MTEIIVYSKSYCPYCTDAKGLLQKKGAAFTEVDIQKHPERRDEMIKKAGGKTTVPQIFINSTHIGGCDDIYALERQGKLDALLKA